MSVLSFSVFFVLLFSYSSCATREEILYDRLCGPKSKPSGNATAHLAKAIVTLHWRCQQVIVEVPANRAQYYWHPNFRKDQVTTVIFVGFDETTRLILDAMVSAYNCRDDTNIITINLSNFLDALEVWDDSSFNVIGSVIGRDLANTGGLVYDKFHFVGYGFGAHIAANAARHYVRYVNKAMKNRKAQIPRITGLDPIGEPCFHAKDGHVLNSGDAFVVDIIYSNPSKYGIYEAHGHQNFYVGSLTNFPPGCGTDECAHSRAWKYFVESVYPNQMWNFKGKRCVNLNSVMDFRCDGREMLMGLDIDPANEGIAFVNVHQKPPYGLDSVDYVYVMNKKCGVCTVWGSDPRSQYYTISGGYVRI